MVKRLRLKRLKNKAHKLWRLLVLYNFGGKCSVEGCCKDKSINVHHILPREYYNKFRFEVLNGIPLCAPHHKYGALSAHKNPVWFYLQVIKHQNIAMWVFSNMGNTDKHTFTEGDLMKIVVDLQSLCDLTIKENKEHGTDTSSKHNECCQH